MDQLGGMAMKTRFFLILFTLTLCIITPAEGRADTWRVQDVATGMPWPGFNCSLALNSHNQAFIAYGNSAVLTLVSNRQGYWRTEDTKKLGTYDASLGLAIDRGDHIHLAYGRGRWKFDLDYCSNVPWNTSCGIVTEVNHQTNPVCSLAVGSDQHPYIAYVDRSNGLMFAEKQGGEWVIENVDDTYGIGDCALALDPSGRPCIAYRYGYEDFLDYKYALKYAVRTGGVWSREQVVDDLGGAPGFDLAVNSQGYADLVYIDRDAGALMFATNSGGTWSVSTIYDANYDGGYCSIALDRQDKVHVIANNWNLDSVIYTTNLDGSWPVRVVDYATVVQKMSMVVDPYDMVHASYLEYDYDAETATLHYAEMPTSAAAVLGEVGVIEQGMWDDHWFFRFLQHDYDDPVVIMRALPDGDSEPAHARVLSAGTGLFTWKIEEWDYLDGDHQSTSCPYLAVEAGDHLLADGTPLKAGKVLAEDGVWQQVTFPTPFTGTPAVLTGVMSSYDPSACIARVRNVTSTGFEVMLQDEEAAAGPHGPETVGWMAIPAGRGAAAGMKFSAGTAPAVDSSWQQTNYGAHYFTPPVYFCQDVTFNDPDPAACRFKRQRINTVALRMEEEQSVDEETLHQPEDVAFFAVDEPGYILGLNAPVKVSDTVAGPEVAEPDAPAPDKAALSAGITAQYPDPFNPVTNLAFTLPREERVNLSVFDVSGRRVAVLEDGVMGPGQHVSVWNAGGQSSGLYFARLVTSEGVFTERMILVR